MASNLFTKKKATAKKTTTKKDNKTIIVVSGDEFATKISRFNVLKKEVANLSSELKTIEGDIKEEGVDNFIELYEKRKRNPGSFKLASEDGEKVLIVPMDRYLKLDEERAEELKEEFGADVVEENTTFTFNGSLLNKYQEQISELIMNADFMTDKEKEDLIVASTKMAIKKGAINEAMTLGKGQIIDFLGSIAPVIALKQTK